MSEKREMSHGGRGGGKVLKSVTYYEWPKIQNFEVLLFLGRSIFFKPSGATVCWAAAKAANKQKKGYDKKSHNFCFLTN
jgi:hypothetical protein